MHWFADYARSTACCWRATDQELAADPGRYECTRCELKARRDRLWAANAEAWAVYQTLCGRTVREAGLQSPVLQAVTQGWDGDRLSGLLRRLDVILETLHPVVPREAPAHGQAAPHRHHR